MPLNFSVVFVFNFKERKSQICTKERCVCLSVLMAGKLVPTIPPKQLLPSTASSLHLALPLSQQHGTYVMTVPCSSSDFPSYPFSVCYYLRAQFLDWISPQNSRLTYPVATCLIVIPNYNTPTTAFLVFSQHNGFFPFGS